MTYRFGANTSSAGSACWPAKVMRLRVIPAGVLKAAYLADQPLLEIRPPIGQCGRLSVWRGPQVSWWQRNERAIARAAAILGHNQTASIRRRRRLPLWQC